MIVNTDGLVPDFIVRMIQFFEDRYTGGETDFTVTSLASSPRQFFLGRRHEKDIKVEAADQGATLLGHAFHYALESMPPEEGELVEQRFKAAMFEHTVSGQADRMVPYRDGYDLYDAKSPKAWALRLSQKIEWIRQINLLALLALAHGKKVLRGFVCANVKDWDYKEVELKHNDSYPQHSIVVQRIDLWTTEEQQAYLADRMKLFISCENLPDDELPECTSDERWADVDRFAVKKKGNKRAMNGGANFTSRQEAELFAGQQSVPTEIEFRPGLSKRCHFFCDYKGICNQYLKYKEEVNDGGAVNS